MDNSILWHLKIVLLAQIIFIITGNKANASVVQMDLTISQIQIVARVVEKDNFIAN